MYILRENPHPIIHSPPPLPAESFVGKGRVYKGVRRHARMRTGEIRYMHSHYYVRLEEGTPPADYYGREKTPEQQLDEWVDNMRKRKITHSL